MSRFIDLLEDYRGVLAVAFMAIFITLIVLVTLRVFFGMQPEQVSGPIATCYGILVGAPFAAPVLSFIGRRLEKN